MICINIFTQFARYQNLYVSVYDLNCYFLQLSRVQPYQPRPTASGRDAQEEQQNFITRSVSFRVLSDLKGSALQLGHVLLMEAGVVKFSFVKVTIKNYKKL